VEPEQLQTSEQNPFGPCDDALVNRVAQRRLKRHAKDRPMLTPEELAIEVSSLKPEEVIRPVQEQAPASSLF
jgi:hypothetical protein